RLGGDARRPRGVDQRERMREHRRGGLQRGRADRRLVPHRRAHLGVSVGERGRELRARLGRAVDRARPQPGGVGVDPEDDLGLARRDRGGEPVSEGWARRRYGRRRPIAGARHRLRGAGCYLTAFLRPDPAVKRGTRLAAIVIVSPVRGLRPSRAPRLATWNLPKPVKLTSPPDLSSLSMVLITASTALPA